MTLVLFIAQCFGLFTAILSAALVLIRVIESVYQLRQKPELNTLGKVIQVLKNFFTLETYKQ